MSKETVDKGWMSGVYWKGKYDALLADYQRLIHELEELKRESPSAGHRNNDGPQAYLLGGNKGVMDRRD